MADARFVLAGTDTVTMSARAADELIRSGDGTAALLYLCFLRNGGTLTVKKAAAAIGKSEDEALSAMSLLSRIGLLCRDGALEDGAEKSHARNAQPEAETKSASGPVLPDEPPEYTAADIKREIDNGTVFSSLVCEVRKALGKLMTSDDLIRLFGIYDYLGLPPEVILHLVTWCADENHRRYGEGRAPTMHYIEKVAYTWEREGIVTLERAEAYIRRQEQKRGQTAEIKRILQIRDRELTNGERKFVDGWLELGFGPEVIELAYERTFLQTNRLAWSYMDTILKSWHASGYRTAEEIRKKDVRPGSKNSSGQKSAVDGPKRAAAPDPDDIRRMQAYLKQLKGE